MGTRTYKGFKPSTIYNIDGYAKNAAGNGPLYSANGVGVYQHTTGDLTTPNAPTGFHMDLTRGVALGTGYLLQIGFGWTSPVNVPLTNFDLEIYTGVSSGGTTDPNGGQTLIITLRPGANAITDNWPGQHPNTAYSSRIRAKSKLSANHPSKYSGWSDWADAANPPDFSISPPATASVSVKGNDFLPAWDEVTDIAVVGYGLWANTSNSFSGAKLFKRVHKPALNTPIPVGTVNLTDGTTKLEYDIPYYWFVTSYSGLDNDSTTATSCGSAEVVNMSEWQRAFHMPWKMKGLSLVRHVISGVDNQSYAVPAGYVWLITGYYLKANKSATPGPAANTYIGVSNSGAASFLDAALGVEIIQRSPQYTNGIFLSGDTGDSVQLYSDEATGSAWFRAKQFKADDVITTVLKNQAQTSPYTVPTGKNFVLCYAIGGSPRELEESIDGGSNWAVVLPSEADPKMFSIADDGGVLVFPAATQLRCSTGSGNAIVLIGYEIAAP